MSPSPSSILDAVRKAGAALLLRAGRVAIDQPSLVPPSLRRRVEENNADLVAFLQSAGDAACPERAGGPTSETSETPSLGSSAGFAGSVPEPFTDTSASFPARDARPTSCCYACGGALYWSLPLGSAWVCEKCHPTDRPHEFVVWHFVHPPTIKDPTTRRRSVGCPNCLGAGFLWYGRVSWTVCPSCNSGFDGEGGGA